MSDTPPTGADVKPEPWVEVTGSPHLFAWLAEQRVSLAFTTYQTGKLFLLGRHPEGRLAVFERTFNRAMGLWADGQTLWLSTLYQLWRFENLLRPGELYQGHDRLYVPKMANTTGDLDIHDVAVDHTGRPVFVATQLRMHRHSGRAGELHAALAAAVLEQAGRRGSLSLERPGPGGRPSALCHGGQHERRGRRLARPAPAMAASCSTIPDGRVIASGLSMPHSPRLYRGPPLAAQLRHWPLWQHRSRRRSIRAADVLPGLPARPRLRRRLCRRGAVPPARRQDFRRAGARQTSWPDARPTPAAAC